MAIITGITAAKMQEYVDENITDGFVNEMGNLILVTRNGVQIDAGSSIPTVPLGSETEPGRVEFADNAEAIAGVVNDRAITPWNLANLVGYRYWQTIKYTSSGTFQKSIYTNMRAIRVRVQGGGGSGGPAGPASAGQHSCGAGGGGGGYAEKIIFEQSLAASETVTVGAGGVGPTTGGQAGNTGGTSSFGTHAVAAGGLGGNTASNQSLYVSAPGGEGGIGTAGDILLKGSAGGHGTGYATLGNGGHGGGSQLGGGAHGTFSAAGAISINGFAGGNYGGGGGGALSNQSASGNGAGGNGAPGIVLVDVYI